MHLVAQLLLNQVSCVLINLPPAERGRETGEARSRVEICVGTRKTHLKLIKKLSAADGGVPALTCCLSLQRVKISSRGHSHSQS